MNQVGYRLWRTVYFSFVFIWEELGKWFSVGIWDLGTAVFCLFACAQVVNTRSGCVEMDGLFPFIS